MGVTVRVPGRDTREGSRCFHAVLSCPYMSAFLTAFGDEALGRAFCILVTALPAWCPASVLVKAEFPRNSLVLKCTLCQKPFLDTVQCQRPL